MIMILSLAGPKLEGIHCVYLAEKDKVLFTDSRSVSVRKDLNGVLLLDTALQTNVAKTEDVVKVELPLPEVSVQRVNINRIFKWLIDDHDQEI